MSSVRLVNAVAIYPEREGGRDPAPMRCFLGNMESHDGRSWSLPALIGHTCSITVCFEYISTRSFRSYCTRYCDIVLCPLEQLQTRNKTSRGPTKIPRRHFPLATRDDLNSVGCKSSKKSQCSVGPDAKEMGAAQINRRLMHQGNIREARIPQRY